jgi:hypothetical protein
MSRAELEHALARVLEGKEIRLKNNKLTSSAALHRAVHNSTSQNALAGYLRRYTLTDPEQPKCSSPVRKPIRAKGGPEGPPPWV